MENGRRAAQVRLATSDARRQNAACTQRRWSRGDVHERKRHHVKSSNPSSEGCSRGERHGKEAELAKMKAEIMREITDDILEMVEMDVEGEEAGPRGWLPPAG